MFKYIDPNDEDKAFVFTVAITNQDKYTGNYVTVLPWIHRSEYRLTKSKRFLREDILIRNYRYQVFVFSNVTKKESLLLILLEVYQKKIHVMVASHTDNLLARQRGEIA